MGQYLGPESSALVVHLPDSGMEVRVWLSLDVIIKSISALYFYLMLCLKREQEMLFCGAAETFSLLQLLL